MESRIMQVFYGNDCLPYKDSARSVHYPIVGNSFLGANGTTQIRFYVRDIGGVNNVSWIAISKLPNGKIGNQVLSSIHLDSELNEYYIALDLSSYYTQLKGDVYISLNGYQGGVQVEEDEDTGIYTIVGTPIIEATGSIKLAINYAPQLPQGQHFNISDLQQILGALSDKANIVNTVQVVADISDIDLTGFDIGQLFYDLDTKQYYEKISDGFKQVDDVGVLASNNVLVRYTCDFSSFTFQQAKSLFGYKMFILNNLNNNIDYLCQFLKTGNIYSIKLFRLVDFTSWYATTTDFSLDNEINDLINSSYVIRYVVRRDSRNTLYAVDSSGNQINIKFEDLLRNYINVANYQENVSVIIDPLTNVNGWVLTNYESSETTISGYPCYKITRDGNNLTEEQAKTYLKAMTGSEFLPKYDYDEPKNSFMLMPNGLFLKPQYDNTNGLVLYKTKRFADVDYVNNAIETVNRNSFINVDTSEYPTLQDFLDNYDGEEGHIYLYPIDTNDINKGYYQYIWEDDQEWEYLGTTQIDLSAYALTSYVDNRDNYIIGLCNNLYYELGQTNDELSRLAGLFSLYGSYYIGGHTLYVDTATISDNTITLIGTVASNTLSVTPVTSFYTKTEIDNLLAAKVDKTSSTNKVYGTDYQGNQTTYDVDSFYEGNIARRDSDNSITIPLIPTQNGHATSKQYVDGMAYSLEVSMNNSTYVVSFLLKDKNGNTLSSQSVDLPLESFVVDGDYDPQNETIVLTLNNGNTISIPVSDLVSGLVNTDQLNTTLQSYATKQELQAQNTSLRNELNSVKLELDNLASLLNLVVDNFITNHILYSKTTTISTNTATIVGTISGNTLVLTTSAN